RRSRRAARTRLPSSTMRTKIVSSSRRSIHYFYIWNYDLSKKRLSCGSENSYFLSCRGPAEERPMSAIFNPDELAAQALAGLSASGAGIRPAMPDQHRDFFRLLPYLFAATTDVRGWPMASILTGAPGFVHSPDPATLRIDALAAPEDPASSNFHDGSTIGLLGLDLTTRRRNRANGRVAAVDDRGLTVAIDQSFGNCAQYIQVRRPA